MRTKKFAIKNHKIVCEIDCAPYSEEKMNNLCREKDYDGWFEFDKESILTLFNVGEVERMNEKKKSSPNHFFKQNKKIIKKIMDKRRKEAKNNGSNIISQIITIEDVLKFKEVE